VTKETFDLYFSGCTRGIAIELDTFTPCEPPINLAELRRIWPAFSALQSHRYVTVQGLGNLDHLDRLRVRDR
jgi:predicted transcriptional regulator